MKSILKWILFPILRSAYNIYSLKERRYSYQGIQLIVLPGVFHPGFFFSTKVLLKFINKLNIEGKNILELGAGSGLISVYCAAQKAIVTASDVNPSAVKNIFRNAKLNNVEIEIVESDLFTNIVRKHFDYIIINPPYFPKNPQTEKELAWFCGEDFDYFKKLFQQLRDYIENGTKVFMILSEDCEILKITHIAEKSGFNLNILHQEKVWGEKNIIYRID